jgi:transposase-like protein
LLRENRLNKFNGFTNDKFILHLKECEFRSNNRNLTKKEFEKMILRMAKRSLKEQRKNKIS